LVIAIRPARYIQKLPKAEQRLEEWLTAVEALLLVVEHQSPDDDGAHRRHEGIEPSRRSGVQSRSQGPSLGDAENGN
jgi:hypothetical protein